MGLYDYTLTFQVPFDVTRIKKISTKPFKMFIFYHDSCFFSKYFIVMSTLVYCCFLALLPNQGLLLPVIRVNYRI